MPKKVKYTDYNMGKVSFVEDFLPSPAELARKEKSQKVTIQLSEEIVSFFKEKANENNTQYQKMIRRLLDEYVARQKRAG